jgi:hypothetical protein
MEEGIVMSEVNSEVDESMETFSAEQAERVNTIIKARLDRHGKEQQSKLDTMQAELDAARRGSGVGPVEEALTELAKRQVQQDPSQPLSRLFGKSAVASEANKLALENPTLYHQLKKIAKERKLC